MSTGHHHDARFGGQNLGNSIGNRSCVRQSKTFRQYESGNTMKGLLGTSHLGWDVNKKQGAYSGAVYDAATDGAARGASQQPRRRRQQQQQQQQQPPLVKGGGGVGGLQRGGEAIYHHSDGTTERVRVVKEHGVGEGGGFTIWVPSLQRERSTVHGRLLPMDGAAGPAAAAVAAAGGVHAERGASQIDPAPALQPEPAKSAAARFAPRASVEAMRARASARAAAEQQAARQRMGAKGERALVRTKKGGGGAWQTSNSSYGSPPRGN